MRTESRRRASALSFLRSRSSSVLSLSDSSGVSSIQRTPLAPTAYPHLGPQRNQQDLSPTGIGLPASNRVRFGKRMLVIAWTVSCARASFLTEKPSCRVAYGSLID